MPFDSIAIARPYMREGTAALAALVASNPPNDVLRLVHAELHHRSRPAAVRLAQEVAAKLNAAPAFEVVPCIHGELAPEAREVVVSVERSAAPPVRRSRDVALPCPGDHRGIASPKHRTAWNRLSTERRAHWSAWHAWREAWRAWRYAGGADPGPAPMDGTSPEALALAERAKGDAAREAERLAAEAAHLAHWGGDLEARDAAVKSAPRGDMNDPAHVAVVHAHMAAAAEEARKRAAPAPSKAAEATPRKARPSTGTAAARNRAVAF